MEIRLIGIVGSGTMGSGIAQVAVQQGFHVLLYDVRQEALQTSLAGIAARIDRLAEKGKIPKEAAETAKNRIHVTTDLEQMASCQVVIEAVPETLDMKQQLFQRLDDCCPPETILASNTSSLSITQIGSVVERPERVGGMHFFNPVPLMPLVEIVQGIQTSDATVETLSRLAVDMGKHPVKCKDTPGFIVNRVARPYYNEALRILGDGVASVEQIDRIMKQAGKFPMGPFELQDLIGIDVNFSTTQSVFAGFFGDSRFRPHFYQQRLMQAGQLGRKSGRGYYRYEG
nr:3-hydroxyacyl-CoA dehydrogenase NAD-binding domain-containing protein [Effusibacillus pohliae]